MLVFFYPRSLQCLDMSAKQAWYLHLLDTWDAMIVMRASKYEAYLTE